MVILCAAALSPAVMAWGVGAVIAVGGVGIAVLDPPLWPDDEIELEDRTDSDADAKTAAPVIRPRRREWLSPALIAVLVMAFGSTVLLSGTELAIVATLKAAGQVSWAGVVVAVYGLSSIVGGLVYGIRSRPRPTWLLLTGLALATIPAGLAHSWPALCVAGIAAGLLTAPTLSAVADAVSRLAPAGVRGEATGLQSSALSAGFAVGSPMVGAAIDLSASAVGFAAAGVAGLAAAVTGYLLSRRQRSPRGCSTNHQREESAVAAGTVRS
jgi:MFS family permease